MRLVAKKAAALLGASVLLGTSSSFVFASEGEDLNAPDAAVSRSVPCSHADDSLPPGDTVTDGPVGAGVAQPGTGTTAWAISKHGIDTLSVQRSRQGTVTVTDCGNDGGKSDNRRAPGRSSGSTGVPPSPPACEDDAYNYPATSYKWRDAWAWRFDSKSTPREIPSNSLAKAALRNAMHNVTRLNNDCGLTNNINPQARYTGHTVRSIDIVDANTISPSCKSPSDGVSVVDFGQVGSGSYVFLCTYWTPHTGPNSETEVDMRLNKNDWEWTVDPLGQSCGSEMGVEPVATVGRGAGFGLGAVPESIHGNLTMSQTPNGPCQNEESTLGLGDVLGLRSLY